MGTPFMLAAFPRAIVHLDGDAFFTSVEQALKPELLGRPVVTGLERGIIACASYEAKALGIARGMPLFEARRRCPQLVVLPSDYETYGLYSCRLFNILRRFTPMVEEYSIDEGFADLTGLRRHFRASYVEIARRMQEEVARDLGLTVSVGLAPTKSVAKICSKLRKPRGFTVCEGRHLHELLETVPLEKVWGFGPNTVELLKKFGLRTAGDFTARSEAWAGRVLGKIGRDIWRELRGQAVHEISSGSPALPATMIKSKTVLPPSADRDRIYAQLVQNVEAVLARARRFRLRPGAVGIMLRRQDFRHDGAEAVLSRSTASTLEALPIIAELFDQAFHSGVLYRATLVMLGRMEDDAMEQGDLFEDRVRIEKMRRLTAAVDAVNAQYGRQTLHSAAVLDLRKKAPVARDAVPARRETILEGETSRRRLGLPRWNVCV